MIKKLFLFLLFAFVLIGAASASQEFNISAIDAYTSSDINSFNATVNGYTHTTTSGNIAFNTTTDWSGNNNWATVNGATYNSTYQSYEFDGINDYLQVADSAELNITSNINVSVRVTFNTINPAVLVAKRNTAGSISNYMLDFQTTYLRFVMTGLTNPDVTVNWVPELNKEYLLEAVYNGTHLNLYANGVQIDSEASSGTATTTADPLLIGKRPGGTPQYFNGSISEVEIISGGDTVLYLPFSRLDAAPDTTLVDRASYSRLATNNGATYNAADSAYEFDGSDNMDLGNEVTNNWNAYSNLSISATVNPASLFGANTALVGNLRWSSAVNNIGGLYIASNNKFAFRLSNGSASCVIFADSAYTPNTEYDVTGWWDGSTCYISVDGVTQANTGAFAGPINYLTPREFYIGASWTGASNFFIGNISSVEIRNQNGALWDLPFTQDANTTINVTSSADNYFSRNYTSYNYTNKKNSNQSTSLTNVVSVGTSGIRITPSENIYVTDVYTTGASGTVTLNGETATLSSNHAVFYPAVYLTSGTTYYLTVGVNTRASAFTVAGGTPFTSGDIYWQTDQIDTDYFYSVTNITYASTANPIPYIVALEGNLAASLIQNILGATVTEKVSGAAVSSYTINTSGNGGSASNSTGNILYLAAGNYTIDWSKSGYYPTSNSYEALGATSGATSFTVHNHILNLSINDLSGQGNTSNFTVSIYSDDYTYSETISTTNASAIAYLIHGNYTLYLNDSNYALTSYELQLNNTDNFTSYQMSAYTTNSVNFTFIDEQTGAIIDFENITIYLTGSINSYNYVTDNGSLYIDLISPDTYDITYSAPSYSQREYSFTLTNRTTNNLNLYLLNTSTTNYETIITSVIDTFGNDVAGAIVYAQKKNLSGTNYYTVEMCTTDSNGQCILYLDTLTTTYRFRVEKDGSFVTFASTGTSTSGDTQISSTTLTLTVQLLSDTNTEIIQSYEVTTDITYNNNTKLFTYTWSDSNSLDVTACLEVIRRTGGSSSQINYTCTTSSSGSITNTINTSVGDEYIAKGYIIIDGLRSQRATLSVVVSNLVEDLGAQGIFIFGFLITMTAAFVGLYNPIMPIIIIIPLLVTLQYLNLVSFGLSALGGLIVAGITLIYLMNK